MNAISSMTHRATVKRDVSSASNDWEGEEASDFVVVASGVRCRVWSKARKWINDDGKEVIMEDIRALIGRSADIEEGDRLTITNRLHVTLFDGPIVVKSKQLISGPSSQIDHYELILTRHK